MSEPATPNSVPVQRSVLSHKDHSSLNRTPNAFNTMPKVACPAHGHATNGSGPANHSTKNNLSPTVFSGAFNILRSSFTGTDYWLAKSLDSTGEALRTSFRTTESMLTSSLNMTAAVAGNVISELGGTSAHSRREYTATIRLQSVVRGWIGRQKAAKQKAVLRARAESINVTSTQQGPLTCFSTMIEAVMMVLGCKLVIKR